MGRITIDSATLKLDDRALAHLEIVILEKLRRKEPFFFTWAYDASVGSGRESRWVHPQVHLDFRFDTRFPPELNRRWVKELMHTANSPNGLYLVDEPSDD